MPLGLRQHLADGGLRDVQQFGGAAHAPGEHHRAKHFHLPQVHRLNITDG